ncbi:MAG: glycosyltransferase [Reinekea sp.]
MTNYPKQDKLKILHIISGDLWAGAEVQAYTLLKHLQPHCTINAIVLNKGILADKIESLGIPVTILDENQLSFLQIFKRTRQVIRQTRPNIIHTHRQKENILGAIANATTNRAKCLRTVHGAPEFSVDFRHGIQRYIDKWVGNNLQQKVIAVSDELSDKISTSFRKNHIEIIHNGVDVNALKATVHELSFDKTAAGKKHIGIIGRLVQVKRVDLFLETVKEAQEQKLADQYHFHVIGDGPLRKKLEAQIDGLGIANMVTLHGHRDDISSCINALDAVVLCSDHEGMPMIALETAALGKALVIRDCLTIKQYLEASHEFSTSDSNKSLLNVLISLSKTTTDVALPKTLHADYCAQKTYSLYKNLSS